MVKPIVDGVTPLLTSATTAVVKAGTLNVSLPLPRFDTLSVALAMPLLQGSVARKTWVVSGSMIG